MRSPLRLCLTLIAFAAMLWAQVFGLHRGFLCDCGGVAELTPFDHCHGPHSESCHDHEEESPCHHDEDDHADETDTHEHTALIEELVAGHVTSMHVAAPAPLVSIAVMPEWLTSEALQVKTGLSSPVLQPPKAEPLRSWPQSLAHTIALRI
jgi:hypothetical protein